MYESPTIPSRLLLWVYTNPAPTRLLRKRDTLHRAWHAAHVLPALRDNVPPTLFLACSRWVAADGCTPTYLSLYDLARHRSDTDIDTDKGNGDGGIGGGGGGGLLWHDPAYVALSEKHAGEARAAASFVEGRVYEPLAAPFPLPSWNDNSSGTDESDEDAHGGGVGKGEGGRGRTRYISVIEVDLHAFAEGEFCRWYDEEHIPLLARVPGWVRSRRYVLKEKLGVGTSKDEDDEGGEGEGAETERGLGGERVATATMDMDADTDTDTDTGSEGGNRDGDAREGNVQNHRGRAREKNLNPNLNKNKSTDDAGPAAPPKFLAIHEWASLDAFETKQYRRATNTPWRTAVLKEERVLRYEIRVFRAA